MNSNIRPMPHVEDRPLSIEREYTLQGREIIVIEGVKYDADYFQTFAHPDTDVLYAIRRDGDQVWLTVIRNAEEAKKFFEEVGQGDLAPTEDQDGL